MVSTEENSLSDLLGAALPKGVLAGLPGLRGISSPDVPAFAAKPAIEAFSYGTATPAMDELAEAALAYTHDEPHAATTQAPATLALVADNGAAGEDAESADVKAEATQLLTEILRMDPEVKAGLGAEIALLKAAQQSGRASGIDFERIRDRIAAAETNAQNSKAESEEQRIQRMLRLEEEVDRAVEENSKYFKEEELRERDRLKALRDQYPVGSPEWINANKALISYDDEIFDRAIDRARAAGDEGAVTSLTNGQNVNNEREEASEKIKNNNAQIETLSGSAHTNFAVADTRNIESPINQTAPERLELAMLAQPPEILAVAHVENEAAGNLPRPRDAVSPPSEATAQALY